MSGTFYSFIMKKHSRMCIWYYYYFVYLILFIIILLFLFIIIIYYFVFDVYLRIFPFPRFTESEEGHS